MGISDRCSAVCGPVHVESLQHIIWTTGNDVIPEVLSVMRNEHTHPPFAHVCTQPKDKAFPSTLCFLKSIPFQNRHIFIYIYRIDINVLMYIFHCVCHSKLQQRCSTERDISSEPGKRPSHRLIVSPEALLQFLYWVAPETWHGNARQCNAACNERAAVFFISCKRMARISMEPIGAFQWCARITKQAVYYCYYCYCCDYNAEEAPRWWLGVCATSRESLL